MKRTSDSNRFDAELNTLRQLGGSSSEPDWAKTIANLMELAKQASKTFDSDRAIYLSLIHI